MLPLASKYQYLGVWLHEANSSDPHVDHVLTASRSASNLLRGCVRPDSPLGFAVMRTFVLSIVLPIITYGLPFVSPTTRQFARLDACLYRPLMAVLGLPMSTHRAGLAVWTGVPCVEVQRERALLALVGSVLRLSSEPAVRANPDAFPTFQECWKHCTQEAMANWEADIRRTPEYMQRLKVLNIRSPFVQFQLAARRWGVVDLLPLHAQAAAPGWSGTAFRAALARRAGSLQRLTWLAETRGLAVEMDGTSPVVEVLPGWGRDRIRRGALLPPLYGVPDAPAFEEPDRLRLLADELTAMDERPPAPYPALELDNRQHSVLRSRIALNRADFNAVHVGGQMRSDRRHPFCEHCLAFPVAHEDTALHVVSECSRYRERRLELKLQLSNVLLALRVRTFGNAQLAQTIHNEEELFFHVVMAAPHVLDLECIRMHRSARERLLRLTGSFLEFIRTTRPV